MTDHLETQVRRAVPLTDADAVRPVRDGTRRDLLDRITAEARGTAAPDRAAAPRRSRRWTIGLPAAVGVACAVTVASLIPHGGGPAGPAGPGPSAGRPGGFDPHQVAALGFTERAGHIEVRIKDPLADPERYRREFAAHGMKIKLTMVPASPSVVGTIVMQDSGDGPDRRRIETIEEGRCVTGGGGETCLRGLRIPDGYRNTTEIAFGRAARPGEQFNSTNSAFAPGEALHCTDVRGLTVAEAEQRVRQRNAEAKVFHYETGNQGFNVGREKIPGNWYVTDADPWAPGQVMLWVQQDRPAGKKGAHDRALFKDCPR